MRFIFIFILSLPFYFDLSAQINAKPDTTHLRRHISFFERNSIPIAKYNFADSTINNSLHKALLERNHHRSNLIGGLVFAGLGVAAFSLIQTDQPENPVATDSFQPITNLFLITFGVCFTIDSGVCIIRSFNHQKKMKQNLTVSRELLI